MKYIRSLYDWVLSWAYKKTGHYGLAFISFTESIFFPIPPDVLLIPMILANISKAWLYALVATIASVAGGVLGYLLGFIAYEQIAEPLLIALGKEAAMNLFANSINQNGFVIVLTAGVSPIPFKVVSIMSGFTKMQLSLFILSALLGRAIRFFIVATLLKYYGEKIKFFLEKYLGWLFLLFIILLVAGTIGLDFLWK